ncbi:MAG: class I adenylate-forming enzyme family protein [Thermodesulfobacteriota bacterium]
MSVNREHASPTATPLMEVLRAAAGKYPGKTALVQGEKRLRYPELVELIDLLARDLRERGVFPGHLVALRFPNSIAYIVLTYAVWKCGGAVLPIAVELTGAEVGSIFNRIRPDFCISDRANGGGEPMACTRLETSCFFEALKPEMKFQAGIPDLAFVRFTSGTTGTFKGVALSHGTIIDRITALNRMLRIGPDDTVVWVLSMAHHFVSTIVLYLSSGASIVLSAGVPAERILDAVEKEQATVLYAAPFHYALLSAEASQRKMTAIRMAISTTISLPESVFMNFYNRFGLPILQAYGIIETGLVCVNIDNPLEKKNSVGRAVTGYDIEIRDRFRPVDGEPECGRLFVRGPGFFNAYFSPFRAAETVLENGWFDTGDVGRKDPEGFVYILGRHKDLINVAGMKVFPQEVERVLDAHPDIRESRVFGMESTRHGEVVAAEVVPAEASRLTERDLRNYCRSRLASYKIPGIIRFVDHIEKTAVTSKIIRHRREAGRAAYAGEIEHAG